MTEGLVRLRQDIHYPFEHFAGKNLTLSAKIDGAIITGTGLVPIEKPTEGTSVQYVAVGVPDFGINLNYSIKGDYFVPYIALAYSRSINVEWMKLEIGDTMTPYTEPDYQTELIKINIINGDMAVDGREIELNKSDTHIQWRYVGDEYWSDLISLSEITGSQGEKGVDGTSITIASADKVNGVNTVTFSDGTSISIEDGGGYTYIVDSDEALLNWANNVSGNDYTHVLIKRGTWTMDFKDGINLTTTGTLTVTGEVGNLIRNVGENEGTMYVLKADEQNTNFSIDGVNAFCSNSCVGTTANGNSTNYPKSSHSVCFYNLCNVRNCSADGSGTAYATTFSTITGFHSCNHVINCHMKTVAADNSKTVVYFFRNCKYVSDCYGTSESSGQFITYGIYGCSYITNCSVNLYSYNSSYGFFNCEYIENCSSSVRTGAVSNEGSSRAYSNCNHILNSYGYNSMSTCIVAENCKFLSNCYIDSAGSITHPLKGCTNVVNCKFHSANINGGSCILNCTGVQNCTYIIDTNNNPNGSKGYSGSSANHGEYNADYACANTVEGGWNCTYVADTLV